MLLLDDGRIVRGASSETSLDQQLMQLDQARCRHPRGAEPHPGADGRIQHPCRDNDDHAGRHLDMHDLTAGPPLGVEPPKAAPMQRVPAVADFDFLPDMGRMTPRLHKPHPHAPRKTVLPGPPRMVTLQQKDQRRDTSSLACKGPTGGEARRSGSRALLWTGWSVR